MVSGTKHYTENRVTKWSQGKFVVEKIPNAPRIQNKYIVTESTNLAHSKLPYMT
jgi:hypothetical protein